MPEDFLFVRGVDTVRKATYARNVPTGQPCILPVQRLCACTAGSAAKVGDVLFVKGVDHIRTRSVRDLPVDSSSGNYVLL